MRARIRLLSSRQTLQCCNQTVTIERLGRKATECFIPTMHLLALLPSFGASAFLVVALALAFGFECVNGFHDTANAVATVIYTNTLKPWIAVVWSGLWNLIGVLTSSGAVAFGIVA